MIRKTLVVNITRTDDWVQPAARRDLSLSALLHIIYDFY